MYVHVSGVQCPDFEHVLDSPTEVVVVQKTGSVWSVITLPVFPPLVGSHRLLFYINSVYRMIDT